MINNSDNLIIPSFVLFIDNILCNQAQGYTNYSSQLYPVTDNRIAGFNLYASPFRSWIADSSVSGATIISGVYDNQGHFLNRNSGIIIDYENGRILTTGNYSYLSGNYAFKDFTVKYTNESEENLIFNNSLKLQAQYNNGPITGINSSSVTAPIVFIKYEPGTDVAFTFGAEYRNTQATFRCIVISDDERLLDACMGFLRDQTEKTAAISSFNNLPYNYYGDLKSGYYSYTNIQNNPLDTFFINKVATMKFSEVVNITIGRNLWGGFCDFTLDWYRNRNSLI